MKLVSIIAIAALGVGTASPAAAIVINNIDVGGKDTIISITNDIAIAGTGGTSVDAGTGCSSSSGDANELCWAEFFTGAGTLTQYDKPENVSIVYADVMGNTYGAFDLTGNPEYYIVKNSTVSILMQNVADLGWGVLDVTDAQSQIDNAGFLKKNGDPADVKLNLGATNQTTISHVTHYNDGNPVPEPATLALMGIGLAGLGLSRRRRQRRD